MRLASHPHPSLTPLLSLILPPPLPHPPSGFYIRNSQVVRTSFFCLSNLVCYRGDVTSARPCVSSTQTGFGLRANGGMTSWTRSCSALSMALEWRPLDEHVTAAAGAWRMAHEVTGLMSRKVTTGPRQAHLSAGKMHVVASLVLVHGFFWGALIIETNNARHP